MRLLNDDHRQLIRLGVPILVGQLGMIVVGFVDNIMVGRYSTQALASAAFVNSVFNVAIFCIIGFTYGVTPLVGALFGRGEHRNIGATMRASAAVNTIFTLVVMAVMTAIYLNVDRMGQPAELLPLIRPYYLLFLAGMIPVSLFNVFAQWAYAIRRSAMPMWIILASNAVNVVGNWLLIYGTGPFPELGLTGAGIATLTSRLVCVAAIMLIFFRRKVFAEYRRGFAAARTTLASMRRIFKTSMPVSLQMTFESGSFSIAGVMAGWIGTVSLAAFQIMVIIGTLGFCVYYSVGSAIAVLVANEAGKGSRHGMRRVAWAGYHIMLTLMALSSLIFALGGKYIICAFTDDPAVIALCVSLIVPLVIYQLGDATQVTFANALRGTSRVMPMLWIAFISYVVVGIPATYIMAFTAGMGTYGIILSFSVSLFLAGGLFLYYFLYSTGNKLSKR